MKLPPCVYLKHGAYWLVKQNKWNRLCSERAGLPAMYRELARLTDAEHMRDFMPAVVCRWLESKRERLAQSTFEDYERYCGFLCNELDRLTPEQVTTKVCADTLRKITKARTHNVYRTILRQVMSFAATEGLRDGHNPVDDIPQRATKVRKRLVVEDDIAAIKADALQHRNGEALVHMIDLATITGQRIGDLLALRWQDVTARGIYFKQQKTGKELFVKWSPKLHAVINSCAKNGDRIGHVIKTQTGTRYTYSGIRSAWMRACAACGIENLNIHDLRRRAGMDAKKAAGNMEAAQRLLGHSDPRQTADYVDGNEPDEVAPAG
jgi:integrase